MWYMHCEKCTNSRAKSFNQCTLLTEKHRLKVKLSLYGDELYCLCFVDPYCLHLQGEMSTARPLPKLMLQYFGLLSIAKGHITLP
jgi:hypothetical protein